jgi:1-acyl-sn-glycerol-3-phosphate acyltransferase
VSVGDTLLAAVFLSARRRHRLRYVLKRELLWDPCLDIVGHRLPNCFVQRGARSSAAEIERVRALARDLGPDDAVLLYPEGTRFTTEKRRAILHRLESSGHIHELKRARALRHVLPPRPGGALAILETCPNTAVVCCAHIGFEGTMRLTDLLSGALVGSRVRVAFWRAPPPPMLPDRDARIGWLFDRGQEVDRWVDAARQERTDPTTTPP